MSNRHRPDELGLSTRDIDAHKRGEKQRIRAGLGKLTGPVADDDVDDRLAPGPAWRTERHHQPELAVRTKRDRLAHWKTKAWKRRRTERRRRVELEAALR